MIETIASSLYFFIPGYVANMCPVIAGTLNLPGGHAIDISLFGEGKTWRGIVACVCGALFTVWIQYVFQMLGVFEEFRIVNYTNINISLFGVLMGLGAGIGDCVKSFFKRRLSIRRGRPFFPFDQLDFVIGGLIFVYPVYKLSFSHVVVILLATPVLHLATNMVGFFLGMKREWW